MDGLLLISVLSTLMVLSTGQDGTTDITQSLMTLLNEETQIRKNIQADLADIAADLSTLQSLQQNVTCGCGWHQQNVAFSATLTTDITSLGVRQQVPFDRVITNIGNGYDARHGEFRAPVTGTYEFSVSMLQKPAQWSGVEVMRDGTAVAKIRTGDGNNWSMAATVVTLALTSGEDVWVEHIVESDSNTIYGQNFSTFSGHLIQP